MGGLISSVWCENCFCFRCLRTTLLTMFMSLENSLNKVKIMAIKMIVILTPKLTFQRGFFPYSNFSTRKTKNANIFSIDKNYKILAYEVFSSISEACISIRYSELGKTHCIRELCFWSCRAI